MKRIWNWLKRNGRFMLRMLMVGTGICVLTQLILANGALGLLHFLLLPLGGIFLWTAGFYAETAMHSATWSPEWFSGWSVAAVMGVSTLIAAGAWLVVTAKVAPISSLIFYVALVMEAVTSKGAEVAARLERNRIAQTMIDRVPPLEREHEDFMFGAMPEPA